MIDTGKKSQCSHTIYNETRSTNRSVSLGKCQKLNDHKAVVNASRISHLICEHHELLAHHLSHSCGLWIGMNFDFYCMTHHKTYLTFNIAHDFLLSLSGGKTWCLRASLFRMKLTVQRRWWKVKSTIFFFIKGVNVTVSSLARYTKLCDHTHTNTHINKIA